MNTIEAQEIKRRGISSVDESLGNGPVHVIKNNKPQYVVMSESQYEDLTNEKDEDSINRIRESLEDYKIGRTEKFSSFEELMKEIRSSETR
tara:strand:+ start:99 stop:371 length:273 start_codon:yes stop_codon:yes gene_type:complete